MATPFDHFDAGVQAALIAFDHDFEQALRATPEPWAKKWGKYKQSLDLKTTYPVPVSAPEFKRLYGEPQYRRLSQRTLSITPDEWQDGVLEKATKLRARDFAGFDDEPAAMAAGAAQASNTLVASLLQSGAATTHEFDDGFFFRATHPHNVFDSTKGQYSNLHTGTPLNLTNIALMKQRLREIKAPNGVTPMGLRLTHVIVGPDLEETALDVRDRKMTVLTAGDGAVDNRHAGNFRCYGGRRAVRHRRVVPCVSHESWDVPVGRARSGRTGASADRYHQSTVYRPWRGRDEHGAPDGRCAGRSALPPPL